jgi:hypothetical protein
MSVMVLTEQGYDAIYPDNSAAAKRRIRESILRRFSSTSSRVGHCIDERWIAQNLIPSLNPREREKIDASVQEMVTDGLITLDHRANMKVLVLTQNGFDAIY